MRKTGISGRKNSLRAGAAGAANDGDEDDLSGDSGQSGSGGNGSESDSDGSGKQPRAKRPPSAPGRGGPPASPSAARMVTVARYQPPPRPASAPGALPPCPWAPRSLIVPASTPSPVPTAHSNNNNNNNNVGRVAGARNARAGAPAGAVILAAAAAEAATRATEAEHFVAAAAAADAAAQSDEVTHDDVPFVEARLPAARVTTVTYARPMPLPTLASARAALREARAGLGRMVTVHRFTPSPPHTQPPSAGADATVFAAVSGYGWMSTRITPVPTDGVPLNSVTGTEYNSGRKPVPVAAKLRALAATEREADAAQPSEAEIAAAIVSTVTETAPSVEACGGQRLVFVRPSHTHMFPGPAFARVPIPEAVAKRREGIAKKMLISQKDDPTTTVAISGDTIVAATTIATDAAAAASSGDRAAPKPRRKSAASSNAAVAVSAAPASDGATPASPASPSAASSSAASPAVASPAVASLAVARPRRVLGPGGEDLAKALRKAVKRAEDARLAVGPAQTVAQSAASDVAEAEEGGGSAS